MLIALRRQKALKLKYIDAKTASRNVAFKSDKWMSYFFASNAFWRDFEGLASNAEVYISIKMIVENILAMFGYEWYVV